VTIAWYSGDHGDKPQHRQSIKPQHILVIKDDRDIARLVERHLHDQRYDVHIAHDGVSGLKQALSHPYDLIVLDLMLPGMEGLEACRNVRTKPNYTPILMLTAKSTELDRVLSLDVGADDYLTKPFSIREFLARVKALFRRMEALGALALCVHTQNPSVYVRGGDRGQSGHHRTGSRRSHHAGQRDYCADEQ
jgi:DNA-binding response OmpR family regulator